MSVRDDRPRRPQDQAASHVYVIGSPGSAVVKLGTTTQLTKRLRTLQLSSPVSLEVLWSTPGDRDDEAALHQRFSAFRQHGEWFDFGSEDPVAAVRAAFAAGLAAPRAGKTRPRPPATPPIPEHSLCTCGHEFSFHHGNPRACTVTGWDEWLDCQCGRFVLPAPDWHVGLPACEHCGHVARDHKGLYGPCSWEGGDMWHFCRCPSLITPEVAR